jgi:hypothetical protein
MFLMIVVVANLVKSGKYKAGRKRRAKAEIKHSTHGFSKVDRFVWGAAQLRETRESVGFQAGEV